jgi:hypothetical protein
MAFDDTVISGISARPFDADLYISWSSSAPAGTTFQVYLDAKLVWHGADLACVLPLPAHRVTIDVGAVGAGEATTDFSSSLTPPPGTGSRAELTWTGGAYLDPDGDLAGFRVYGEATPGGGIDYGTVLGTVAAYPGGRATDGFGLGGFGSGGFGSGAGSYSWTSDPLASGTWHFGVRPLSGAGNEGPAATAAVTISVPPMPPAVNGNGKRLTYTYNVSTSVLTLNWLASPG